MTYPTNRIRQLRKEHHMTQVRLGIELGVTQETISSYEREKHYPCYTQLAQLAELFNTSVDYIMGLSDVRFPENANHNRHYQQYQQLLSISRQLSHEQFERAISYMQGMIDASNLEKKQPK